MPHLAIWRRCPGASGSGKSSLVKAVMLSRLMKPQRISGAAERSQKEAAGDVPHKTPRRYFRCGKSPRD
jgi:ABC-type dipeptide/oligopeptide/nickel transport system ATPase component